MTGPSPASTAPRADDGYFGPDSISWRLFADPSSKLGGVVALLLQALNPGMIRLFDKASNDPSYSSARDERTGRYIETTIFGDRAHADAAAAVVRRMHDHARWTDPRTGETIEANRPDWLDWTHDSLVWGILRAADAYGPELSRVEQDLFVVEQHRAAELVGIDPARLPSTRAELDEYVEEQSDWMALSLPAAQASRNLRKPSLRGNPLTVWTGIIIQDGILALLPEWALLLHGIEGRPMNLRAAQRTTKALIAKARRSQTPSAAIAAATARVEAHPYRTVRPKKPGRASRRRRATAEA